MDGFYFVGYLILSIWLGGLFFVCCYLLFDGFKKKESDTDEVDENEFEELKKSMKETDNIIKDDNK